MPEAETWTVGRLLNWTTDYLQQRGADSSRLDAELLLAEACACQRIDLYTQFDHQPPEEVRVAFRELVRRRAEGMPVAYLVGRREFYSMSFRVTPDVLIPRPETEFLVVALTDLVKERAARDGAAGDCAEQESLRIADVGTGSGVLAVCAAKHIPGCRVTAIDCSRGALEVAAANARDHDVADQIELIESDLFAQVPDERQFDFIVSNPPYVTTEEMQELPRDVRDYEPHVALEAGPLGTEVIGRLASQSASRLTAGGYLLCEISPMLEEKVAALFAGDACWESCRFFKDLAGHTRVAQVCRK